LQLPYVGCVPLAFPGYFALLIPFYMKLELAMVLSIIAMKDTHISVARILLCAAAVLDNVETLGQRVAAQSTVAVV
jgi:hypothetical protein